MKRFALAFVALAGCSSGPESFGGPPLRITWGTAGKQRDILTVFGPDVRIPILYLEAYCRSGSTDRKWQDTCIPHKTAKLEESADGRFIKLRCEVQGGVEVTHEIRSGAGEVDFRVEAINRGAEYVDAVWVQPCVRVGEFAGADQKTYVPKSFIFVDGKLTMLDQARRTEEAIYKGGQVYVPAEIDRKDVNPRPLSPDVPSNGLMGCVSADGRRLMALAWEPYQELFQGVIICLHSDFRLGGLKPGETKRAHGKLYVMENNVDRVVARYRQDFPEQAVR